MSAAGEAALLRGLTISLGLAALKLLTALWTGSQSLLASGMDSLSDGLMSGINLRLLREAQSPPDDEHPFGHGKIEGLAALLQAVLLSGVVLSVVWRGLQALLHPGAPPQAWPALAAMALSLCVSGYLSWSLERAARLTGSLVLRSDAAHYRMDLYSGSAVVLGLVLTGLMGWAWADPAASLLVCAWMGRDVAGLFREAADELMDRSLDPEEQEALRRALSGADARVLSWHELRTRRSGKDRFVQAHLVFDGQLSLAEAHEASERVEASIRAALPACHVVLHLDVQELPEDRQRPGAGAAASP
jgi:ferrous-iron efflux pump FieF